jgi:FkbM family methyltransferase
MIKKILKKLLSKYLLKKVNFIKNSYFDGYAKKSYSQEGEDMVLQRIFENQSIGFYIDIGAHHPKRFSNTYLFYKNGWNGINIDAMPNSMKLFNKMRKKDINLEVPISDKKEILTYYMFNEPALNSFSKELTKQRDGLGQYKVMDTKDIKTFTLEEILDKNLPLNQEIDFISIDVEGFDLQVLKSNNWDKYKPKFVLIEILNSSLSNLASSEEYKFLSEVGYDVYAKTMNTVFFKKFDIS